MRRIASGAALFGLAAAALAQSDRVTIPAAASLVGLAPFFSDVRVFNTSYSAPLHVKGTYRCFIGACPTPAPEIHFELAPREARALDDIAADAFDTPDSAGGVEFEEESGG